MVSLGLGVVMVIGISVAVVIGYIIGCVPSAYLAGRLVRHRDIRTLGDGNCGAENAGKQLGLGAGILVGILDIGKGAMAILVPTILNLGPQGILLGGTAAVIGHVWPLPLQFRGGRGAATALGVLSSLLPLVALPLGALSIVGLLLTRSTLTACALAFALAPFLAWVLGYPVHLILYAMLLPMLPAIVHCRQLVLPRYQQTR